MRARIGVRPKIAQIAVERVGRRKATVAPNESDELDLALPYLAMIHLCPREHPRGVIVDLREDYPFPSSSAVAGSVSLSYSLDTRFRPR